MCMECTHVAAAAVTSAPFIVLYWRKICSCWGCVCEWWKR